MPVVVVAVDSAADASQAKTQWSGLGYQLVDVGKLPADFQYFESTDMTAPVKDEVSKYVLVFSDGLPKAK